MSIQQQIASRIEQFMPDLRKQVRLQILKQLSKTNKQILEQKTNEIRELYTEKLKKRAQQIKQNIGTNLTNLNVQIGQLTKEIGEIKNKKLSEDDKAIILEDTVEEIVNDGQMLQEIKMKLYPKIQQNIFEQLQTKLENQLQQYQTQQQKNYNILRTQWQKQRYNYWRVQSQRDIQVLAQEHKQLQCKKNLIAQSLVAKKAERDALLRQQNSLIQANQQISFLKNQIKMLSS